MADYVSDKEEKRAYWDRRAATFGGQCGGGKPGPNRYAQRFLALLDAPQGATVLDMGCATGTLAVPLASDGHEVLACDFSPKMLEKLQAITSQEGLPITGKLMAWEDDWVAQGVVSDSVDIALASRSLGSNDLHDSLAKLDDTARQTVAITVSAGLVPAYEPRLIEYLGRAMPQNNEVVEILGILYEMGRFPHVDYIPCERPMRFDDIDTARLELARMAGPEPFSDEEERMFERYVDQHFRQEETDKGPVYQLDYTLIVP